MLITEVFIWWYAHGWQAFISRAKTWFSNIADFFSMDSLFRTLFKPYRQISAGDSSAAQSFDLKFQMFIDRLVSRLIGFVSRLILIIVGCLIMTLGGLFCLLAIILWPFLPLLPVLGIVLSVIGVAV